MLVLTRKQGERIFIGDEIVITIVTVDRVRKRVRIGITAPSHIKITREERGGEGNEAEPTTK